MNTDKLITLKNNIEKLNDMRQSEILKIFQKYKNLLRKI